MSQDLNNRVGARVGIGQQIAELMKSKAHVGGMLKHIPNDWVAMRIPCWDVFMPPHRVGFALRLSE